MRTYNYNATMYIKVTEFQKLKTYSLKWIIRIIVNGLIISKKKKKKKKKKTNLFKGIRYKYILIYIIITSILKNK